MRSVRGRAVDVDSVHDLDARLAHGVTSLTGWRLCGLDLSDRGALFGGLVVAGAAFVECALTTSQRDDLRSRGAIVVGTTTTTTTTTGAAPMSIERHRLYSPAELYDALVAGGPYGDTLDARTYAWSRRPDSAPGAERASRERTLHDHAIDVALRAWVEGRHLVGVMGGHGVGRGEPAYREAVLLGHGLAEHHTVATGGGPGAMEAANLGAWLRDPAALDPALAVLATESSFRPQVGPWARAAFEVIERWPGGRESLGVPTWFYGHEPPNVFAGAIAKYFRNATREAVLLQVCDRGIVFLPGAAGTVQEIFQDACENYYADESSLAPMILLGARYWREEVPAWPLLEALARDRAMAPHVHLVDSVEEALTLLAPS